VSSTAIYAVLVVALVASCKPVAPDAVPARSQPQRSAPPPPPPPAPPPAPPTIAASAPLAEPVAQPAPVPPGAADDIELADPFRARAVVLYRARVMRILRDGWRCPAATLVPSCTVTATFALRGQIIEDVAIEGCDDTGLTAAATLHAKAKLGGELPQPPPAFDVQMPPTIDVTYACR
jgi:hypothetical protein